MDILSIFDKILGIQSDELTTINVLVRTLIAYPIGIALVRLGNRRFAGKMTAYDIIMAIIIGSLLSRSITESQLFLKIMAACFLLIFMHWSFSYIAARSHRFGQLIKGGVVVLIKDGEVSKKALRKCNLSDRDLMERIRLNAQTTDITKIKLATLERNGDISFVLKDD